MKFNQEIFNNKSKYLNNNTSLGHILKGIDQPYTVRIKIKQSPLIKTSSLEDMILAECYIDPKEYSSDNVVQFYMEEIRRIKHTLCFILNKIIDNIELDIVEATYLSGVLFCDSDLIINSIPCIVDIKNTIFTERDRILGEGVYTDKPIIVRIKELDKRKQLIKYRDTISTGTDKHLIDDIIYLRQYPEILITDKEGNDNIPEDQFTTIMRDKNIIISELRSEVVRLNEELSEKNIIIDSLLDIIIDSPL